MENMSANPYQQNVVASDIVDARVERLSPFVFPGASFQPAHGPICLYGFNLMGVQSGHDTYTLFASHFPGWPRAYGLSCLNSFNLYPCRAYPPTDYSC